MHHVMKTPRMALRPHGPGDVAFMVELNSDPLVVQYTGDKPGLSQDTARAIISSLQDQWQRHRMGRLVVEDVVTGEPLGWCGLKRLENGDVDLGYRFMRRHWGKGLASEAAHACVEHAFGPLGLGRLVAWAAVANGASLRVLEKLGFTATQSSLSEDGMEAVHLELLRR